MKLMEHLEDAKSSLRQGTITREQIEQLQRENTLLKHLHEQVNQVIDELWDVYREQMTDKSSVWQ